MTNTDFNTEKLQHEAVLQALSNMDTDALNKLLSDKYTYNDLSKEFFLKQLDRVFVRLKEMGSQQLHKFPGLCAGCEAGAKVILLVSKETKRFLALVIEKNSRNEVYDIFSCNLFTVKHFPGYKEYTHIGFDTISNYFFDDPVKREMPE